MDVTKNSMELLLLYKSLLTLYSLDLVIWHQAINLHVKGQKLFDGNIFCHSLTTNNINGWFLKN